MKNEQKENQILDLYGDNENIFNECEQYIFPDLWSSNINKQRYDIIKNNHTRGVKTDALLMSNTLIKDGYQKRDIIKVISEPDQRLTKNIKEYVKDLFDAWSRRKILPVLHSSHSELSSEIGEVESTLEEIKAVINDIESVKNNVSNDKSIGDLFEETFKELQDVIKNDKSLQGYSTGLKDLDKITGGLKQEVIVIGAPPSAGKSSLMVHLITNLAVKNKYPVLVHSLEMPGKELMRNIWAASLRINSHNIRLGSLLDEDITRIKNFKIGIKDNLFIDDTSSVTYQYIETKVRRIRRSVPMSEVMVVFIDYIQLMKNIPEETKGISSEEQISLRCNGLLELSKKYNLCVIELSQFARGLVTFDKDKGTIARKPEISDFKGSGGIEANAVQCWLLYREEYYYKDATNTAVKGLCEINIAKNRYGPTGRIYTKFLPKYSSFEDYVKDESEGGDLI